MNSNQEKPGRNSLIIVISLHFFFLPGGTEGHRNPRVDNCSQGCKKVCQNKIRNLLKNLSKVIPLCAYCSWRTPN